MYNIQNMKSKGFTLIELLVVISIISMLSSIVLVAINAAKAKGVIAAALTFDSHNYSAYYLDASVAWDFDGDSGTTARDQSGNGNDLTLVGNASLVTTDTPSGYGKALSIPATDGISGAHTSNYGLIQPPTDGYTISLWLKYTGSPAGGTFVHIITNTSAFPRDYLGNLKTGAWVLRTQNDNILRYMYYYVGQGYTNVPGPIVSVNQWYQVTIVCDKSQNGGTFVFYSNAVKIGSSVIPSYSTNCIFNNTDAIYLASPSVVNNPPYSVDNIRIYRKALPLSMIEKLYAIESEKFKTVAKGK